MKVRESNEMNLLGQVASQAVVPIRVRHGGFALVVTLSLMILLTLLAVGLLSLSSVSLRASRQGEDLARARANARLALMLAIGELQKLAGPDRRVTAPSSILQADSETTPPNGSWTGVWRTDGFKSDKAGTPFLTPDTRSGAGYSDRRAASGRSVDKQGECLGWLVSGSSSDPSTRLPEQGSVIARSGPYPVRVAKVPVSGANGRGALAWFTDDESVKAHLGLADPWLGKTPGLSDESIRRWLTPLTLDPKVVFKGERPGAEEAAKLATLAQIELSTLAGGMSARETATLLNRHADAITVHSRSVLANVAAGGLKADLTAYLEDNAAPALGPLPGISDSASICSELGPTRQSPRFGLLRNWYDLRRQVTRSGDEFAIAAQEPTVTKAGNPSRNIVDPGPGFLKPVIQPVLTEAVCYFKPVVDNTVSPPKVKESIYPRIVIWNPFAVRLKTPDYIVLFEFHIKHVISCAGREMSYQTWGNSGKMPGFLLPGVEMEPGEALAFTAPSRAMSYNDGNLRANALTCSVSPADKGFFLRDVWENSTLGSAFDPADPKNSYELSNYTDSRVSG